MKGFGLDESMFNLTSTVSNETSISSSHNAKYASSSATNNNNDNDNDNDTTMLYAQQASSSSFGSQPQQSQTPAKKKRSLPGNPDPDAEVIALSPKSLLATNRFICEICNKGFQRDQNLQLHRRGHNLPWKLKQRANKDVIIKKVYVCPEQTCVHHDPSRALGDLTGIKKHFCRKHGEKKWNCDKCCKKYAVQSDWKAHSKICGTREYRCDCGTLFSRRDSFITHRAFCDALAQESAISINPLSTTTLSSLTHHQAAMVGISTHPTSHISLPPHNFTSHHHTLLQSFPMKREQEDQHASNMDSIMRQDPDLPLWLACPPPPSQQPQPSAHDHSHHSGPGLSITSPAQANHQAQLSTFQAQYNNPSQNHNHHNHHHQDNNAPTLNAGPTLSSFQVALPSNPHISATALLQRAAQMGVTLSNLQQYHNQQHQQQQQQQQQQHYHNEHITNDNNSQMADELPSSSTVSRGDEHHYQALVPSSSSMLLHDNVSNMMTDNSLQSTPASSMSDSSNFGEFHHQTMPQTKSTLDGGGAGGGNEGMTRDFLGLRTFSHKDFLNMAALGQMKSTSSTTLHQQQQNQQYQTPW